MLKEVLKIMFGMIFTQNYVLVQFIAICPFLGVSKKFDSCIGMSGAVIFVMTLASAVTHGSSISYVHGAERSGVPLHDHRSSWSSPRSCSSSRSS